MDYDKLIAHMRQEAQDYRRGRTLGRAFVDAEDVLENAAAAIENLLSYLSTVEADRGAARKEVERLKTAMHEKGIIDGLDEDRKHPMWCAACRWSRPEEIDKMQVIHCAKLGIPVWNNFFCAFFEESKA